MFKNNPFKVFLFLTFIAMAVAVYALVLDWNPETKTITIWNNPQTNNFSEIQLISVSNNTINFEAVFRMRAYQDMVLDASDYNFLAKLKKGSNATISIFLLRNVNVTADNWTWTYNGNYSIITSNSTNITLENWTISNNPFIANQTEWLRLNNLHNLNVKANRDYYIKIVARRQLSLGHQLLDITPRIGGFDLDDYFAWWDVNFDAKQNITVENRLGVTITNAIINMTRNDTGITKNCADLAWVNQSENEALAYYLEDYSCNTSAINQSIYWIGLNGVADGNSTIYAYYNQTSPASNADNCKLFNASARLILDGGQPDANQVNMACKSQAHPNLTVDLATLHTNTGKFGRGFSMSGNSTSNPGTVGTRIRYNSTYFGTAPATVVMGWFKFTDNAETQGIFGASGGAVDDFNAVLGQGGANGRIRFYTAGCDNIGAGPTEVLASGTWYHLAFKVYDGTNSIYIDGVNVQNISCGGTVDTSAEDFFWIGGTGSGGVQVLKGEWDRFEIWRMNMSDADIMSRAKGFVVRQNAVENQNTAPTLNSISINETYLNTVRTIRIRVNATDVDADKDIVNVTIFTPWGTINESRAVRNTSDFSEFNFTTNLTQGNWTVQAWANDTSATKSTFFNNSFIVDNVKPVLTLARYDNGILLGSGVNFTVNTSDVNVNATAAANIVTVLNPDSTVNVQFNITANTTYAFNSSATGQRGNYTVNFTTTDLAGNYNSTTLVIGFGQINVSISGSLVNVNFSTETDAWGTSIPLQHINKTMITTNLTVNFTVDGELSSRKVNASVNLSIWGNWTKFMVHNSTVGTITASQIGSNLSWITHVMSTGQSRLDYVEVNTDNALNFTTSSVSSSVYRFLVETDITKSFNEYVRIRLPASMQFDKTQSHPRYFVCTNGQTRAFACSTFSTNVDVTSDNSGSNTVAGYPVNLKVYDNGTTVTELSFQTNHTDFLIEIHIISGSFSASPGGGGSPAGGSPGGGGGATIVAQEEVNVCPDGFVYNSNTALCDKLVAPIVGVENTFLTEPILFGLTGFHLLLILVVLSIIVGRNPSLMKKLRLKR